MTSADAEDAGTPEPFVDPVTNVDRRRWSALGRGGTAQSGTAQARSTIRGVLAIQVGANGIGVALVLIYIRLLFPSSTTTAMSDISPEVLGVYIVGAFVIGTPLNALLLRRAVEWVRVDRRPSAQERRLVMWLPALETLTALVTWMGGALLYGLVNESSRRMSIGIALAGVVVCANLYLFMEGHFRPIFALALEDADLPDNRRDVFPRLFLAWLLGSGVPLITIGAAPFIGGEKFDADRLPWLALFSVVAGAAVMALAAVSVSRPLNVIRAALRSVEQGDLTVEVPVDDLGEIGRLAEGVNDLVAGLRERERLRHVFAAQVGEVALADVSGGDEVFDRPGERRHVTVLFVDLNGYTAYSETHSPVEVVDLLNRFFGVVVAVVNRNGGWVNKFEGDAALCVFGAPHDLPDHPARALRAASAIPAELAALDDMLDTKVGVATGEVVAGFIGTHERFEYTVIGDCVNLASRFADGARRYRSGVLVGHRAWHLAGEPEGWSSAGRIRVRGRSDRATVVTLGPAPAAVIVPQAFWAARVA